MAARNASGGGLPVAQGLLVGAAVWVVSAILMFLAGQAMGGMLAAFLSAGPVTFTLLFMIAANVSGVLMGGTVTLTGGTIVFLLIPIFGAVIGGYVVAAGTRSSGAGAGAAVGIGFFVLQVLGVVLFFVMAGGGNVTLGGLGQLAVYLLVGGLVQPAVFGALGGAFAGN